MFPAKMHIIVHPLTHATLRFFDQRTSTYIEEQKAGKKHPPLVLCMILGYNCIALGLLVLWSVVGMQELVRFVSQRLMQEFFI